MKPLKILYVMDPLDAIHIEKDSTFAMMEEAQRRGHLNYYTLPGHLKVRNGNVSARMYAVQVTRQQVYYALGPEEVLELAAMDAVLMRKDPPFNMNYITTTYLLELAEQDTFVLNRPRSLRDANEKLFALKFPDLIPDTLVTADIPALKSFIREVGRAILKPIDERGGGGILLVNQGDLNTNSLLDLSTHYGARHIVAQRYIPGAAEGDKRILFVNGEPKGHFIRVPSAEDHRGNLSAGASAQRCELTARDREICQTIAPVLLEYGLWFTGIDIIGGHLIEINVTSPTGIQEVRKLYDHNIAADILTFLESSPR